MLPLTIRSVFYPLLGGKICGSWGNAIDMLSVLATPVGLAASLGLGVQPVNARLSHLLGIGIEMQMQVILIAFITGVATLSAFAGLDASVERPSQANMIMAGLLYGVHAGGGADGLHPERLHAEPGLLADHPHGGEPLDLDLP